MFRKVPGLLLPERFFGELSSPYPRVRGERVFERTFSFGLLGERGTKQTITALALKTVVLLKIYICFPKNVLVKNVSDFLPALFCLFLMGSVKLFVGVIGLTGDRGLCSRSEIRSAKNKIVIPGVTKFSLMFETP